MHHQNVDDWNSEYINRDMEIKAMRIEQIIMADIIINERKEYEEILCRNTRTIKADKENIKDDNY